MSHELFLNEKSTESEQQGGQSYFLQCVVTSQFVTREKRKYLKITFFWYSQLTTVIRISVFQCFLPKKVYPVGMLKINGFRDICIKVLGAMHF